MIVAFSVEGVPATKGSAKAFKHRTTGKVIVQNDNAKCRAWESAIGWKARMAMHVAEARREGPLAVPVRVVARFRFARPVRTKLDAPRLDVDKLLRALLDGMTGIVYVDDRQVVEVSARKEWGKPGMDVTVETAEGAA